MGMFDYAYSHYPLPTKSLMFEQFQTKSFPDPYFRTYFIDADGMLNEDQRLFKIDWEKCIRDEKPWSHVVEGEIVKLDYTGPFSFHGGVSKVDGEWKPVLDDPEAYYTVDCEFERGHLIALLESFELLHQEALP